MSFLRRAVVIGPDGVVRQSDDRVAPQASVGRFAEPLDLGGGMTMWVNDEISPADLNAVATLLAGHCQVIFGAVVITGIRRADMPRVLARIETIVGDLDRRPVAN